MLYLESKSENTTGRLSLENVSYRLRRELERKKTREIFDEKVRRFRNKIPVKVNTDRLPFSYTAQPSEKEV